MPEAANERVESILIGGLVCVVLAVGVARAVFVNNDEQPRNVKVGEISQTDLLYLAMMQDEEELREVDFDLQVTAMRIGQPYETVKAKFVMMLLLANGYTKNDIPRLVRQAAEKYAQKTGFKLVAKR